VPGECGQCRILEFNQVLIMSGAIIKGFSIGVGFRDHSAVQMSYLLQLSPSRLHEHLGYAPETIAFEFKV
jgi:hypothetical protein